MVLDGVSLSCGVFILLSGGRNMISVTKSMESDSNTDPVHQSLERQLTQHISITQCSLLFPSCLKKSSIHSGQLVWELMHIHLLLKQNNI